MQFPNRLLFFADLIAASLIFCGKFPPRRGRFIRAGLFLAASVAVIALYVELKGILMAMLDTSHYNNVFFWVSYLFNLFYQILALSLLTTLLIELYDIGVSTGVFVSTAAFSMQNIADGILQMLWGTEGGNINSVQRLSDPACLASYLIIYALVCLIAYRLLARSYEYREDPVTFRVLLIVLGISVVNIVLGSVEPPQSSAEAIQLYAFIPTSRLMLGSLGLITLTYLSRWTKLQLDYARSEYVIEQQRRQYEIARESASMVNINAHDLRNQISILKKAALASGNGSAISEELREIEEYVDKVDTSYDTGNGALDLVLTEKSRVCAAREISFSAIAEGSAIGGMKDVDVYVFFGNALDNAIEAAEKLPEAEDRIISFRLVGRRNGAAVHIENTFLVPPKYEDGVLQTIKEGSLHGYGVRSMRTIAEKYGGNLKLRAADGVFNLDCYIPQNI